MEFLQNLTPQQVYGLLFLACGAIGFGFIVYSIVKNPWGTE